MWELFQAQIFHLSMESRDSALALSFFRNVQGISKQRKRDVGFNNFEISCHRIRVFGMNKRLGDKTAAELARQNVRTEKVC